MKKRPGDRVAKTRHGRLHARVETGSAQRTACFAAFWGGQEQVRRPALPRYCRSAIALSYT